MLANCIATQDKSRNRGFYNFGLYANPELDQSIFKSVESMDADERERLLIAATERAMADIPIIPILMLENLWATRKNLSIQSRRDERTLAVNIKPA